MARKLETIAVPCVALIVGALLFMLSGCDSGPQLTSAQADAVAKLEAAGASVKAPQGKVTYVDFSSVHDVPGAIVHVKALPDVEKLNFMGKNTGNDELAHLSRLSELKELGLTGTDVTDDGLIHLAELPKLTVLTLNGCNVSDEGLVHLRNLKALKQLHLNGTKVTDAGLEHLADIESLEALLVYDTAVTSGAAAAFREKRPEIMVVTSEGEVGADSE